jgi:subtilisin family serine protease
MKPRPLLTFFVLGAFWSIPAHAENRFIVRDSGGLTAIQTVCAALGCNVGGTLDGSLSNVFLLTTPDGVNPNTFLSRLLNQPGVADAELDTLAQTARNSYPIPRSLYDTTPVTYFGQTVPEGYVQQPATSIIQLSYTQNYFHVNGAGIVAVIDTGIDPNHPALKNSLVPGYDFTRNEQGEGDETADITLTSTPTFGNPTWVNQQGSAQQSAADIDQSTAAVIDGNPQYSDFGHGTMVAGIVHLVAPGASLMPLKAFRADGTGYNSDIIRAIYFSVAKNANIINMSFNLAAYSLEVKRAIDFANTHGLICVAAAGNLGEQILVYPAAFDNVMGIASTTNYDKLSFFSNFGEPLVWVGAPGEGIVTTYPFATYAAGWGTSFSAPFVSGVAALMLDVRILCDESQSAQAMAHAKPIDSALGNGRLDAYQAVLAWSQSLGLQ